MRFLHTADWHLGRQFEGYSLEADHAAMLDQIFTAVTTHKPDALIIAGDVFDRAAPPEHAVRQLNEFLKRVVSDTTTAIVLIAGNHDSGDRIGSWATLSDPGRVLIRGPLAANEEPLIIRDEHGSVAISAIPFGYEFAARECFNNADIKCPEDVIRAQLAAAGAFVPPGARWIVVAHAFITGGTISGVERPLSRLVGGIETVAAQLFKDAHYVALGHLHRAQHVEAEHIRYSGAPLAYTFDEEGSVKSLSLVDLGAQGNVKLELLPMTPLRRVRTLKGTLAEILAMDPSDDFIRPVLTDTTRLIEPMKRIRERFPNACGLSYARDLTPVLISPGMTAPAPTNDPSRLVGDFMRLVRGTAPSEAEVKIVNSHLGELDASSEVAA
jgi:exonuclease SbcD